MKKVTVIDYGMGNLLSVSRALEFTGAEVELSDQPDAIRKAELLVLPGVGAFPDGMAELKQRKLVEPIRDLAKSGRPLLGICLGMQMLFDHSEEYGNHEGLQLIPGKVTQIPATGSSGSPHKIPHIGWAKLEPAAGWNSSLFRGMAPESYAYFVHSFTAHPTNSADRAANTHYDGCLISAAVKRDNVMGCQFHPEKSGQVGLQILKSFLEL